MAKLFANSEDPDQTPHSAASDLGLHCLSITLLGVSPLQWAKGKKPVLFTSQAKLTITNHCADSPNDKLLIFFLFSQKTGFDISCKLSPMETICMKCQYLFSGKKIRKIYQNVIC